MAVLVVTALVPSDPLPITAILPREDPTLVLETTPSLSASSGFLVARSSSLTENHTNKVIGSLGQTVTGNITGKYREGDAIVCLRPGSADPSLNRFDKIDVVG